MIKIVDYGLGNILAFVNLYKSLNVDISIARSFKDIRNADKLILPGVGTFDHAMIKLNNSGMKDELNEKVLIKKVPVLGICVGMQIMLSSSEEGNSSGLNWIKSNVIKFNSNSNSNSNSSFKVPHMGWNNLNIKRNNPILKNLNNDSRFYFLHSYHCDISNKNHIVSSTNYQYEFTSIFNYENIFGIQCHPEKSHKSGLIFLQNFSSL